jgi:hypothetical protein
MRAFRWPLGVVLGQDRRAGQHRKRRGEPLLAVDDQQPRRRLFRIRPDLPGTHLRAGVPEQQVAENSVTDISGEPPQPEPCASPDQRPGACRGGYQRRGRRCQTQAPYPSEAVAVSGDDGYYQLGVTAVPGHAAIGRRPLAAHCTAHRGASKYQVEPQLIQGVSQSRRGRVAGGPPGEVWERRASGWRRAPEPGQVSR